MRTTISAANNASQDFNYQKNKIHARAEYTFVILTNFAIKLSAKLARTRIAQTAFWITGSKSAENAKTD